MESKINITCETCKKVYEVDRDHDAPKSAVSMGCNWCPKCEDLAEDYYNEWYNDNDDGDILSPDVPDSQLMLFSVTDDILKPELNQVLISAGE